MAVVIHTDVGADVAVIECSGVLRREDAKHAARRLWETPDWSGKSAVWDFRAAEFHVSPSDVRDVAKFILENQREEPPAKMAFVTPRDVDFGMARMFSVFRDDSRTAFRVFRDYEEALAWAGSWDPDA